MTTILQNVRYSFRLLWKNPGFMLVAIATLALGIGANTAIFSVLYESLLAPMPYPDADRLMMVWSKIDGRNPVSAGDFTEWKRQNKTFRIWWPGVAGTITLLLPSSQRWSRGESSVPVITGCRAWIFSRPRFHTGRKLSGPGPCRHSHPQDLGTPGF